jgi:regulator of RNase E activity RraA
MHDTTREKLKHVSVATLTTALFKRGLRHQFIQDVHPLNYGALNMVGEAFTLRYIRRARISIRSPCSTTASIRSARPSKNVHSAPYW